MRKVEYLKEKFFFAYLKGKSRIFGVCEWSEVGWGGVGGAGDDDCIFEEQESVYKNGM